MMACLIQSTELIYYRSRSRFILHSVFFTLARMQTPPNRYSHTLEVAHVIDHVHLFPETPLAVIKIEKVHCGLK